VCVCLGLYAILVFPCLFLCVVAVSLIATCVLLASRVYVCVRPGLCEVQCSKQYRYLQDILWFKICNVLFYCNKIRKFNPKIYTNLNRRDKRTGRAVSHVC
jgi:hypothetical protein